MAHFVDFKLPEPARRRYLEGLPLDLSRSGDRLGLDEEGPRVDQLHTLERLTPCVQVLSLTVPRQMQDGLRHSGGVGGRHLQTNDNKVAPKTLKRGQRRCRHGAFPTGKDI